MRLRLKRWLQMQRRRGCCCCRRRRRCVALSANSKNMSS